MFLNRMLVLALFIELPSILEIQFFRMIPMLKPHFWARFQKYSFSLWVFKLFCFFLFNNNSRKSYIFIYTGIFGLKKQSQNQVYEETSPSADWDRESNASSRDLYWISSRDLYHLPIGQLSFHSDAHWNYRAHDTAFIYVAWFSISFLIVSHRFITLFMSFLRVSLLSFFILPRYFFSSYFNYMCWLLQALTWPLFEIWCLFQNVPNNCKRLFRTERWYFCTNLLLVSLHSAESHTYEFNFGSICTGKKQNIYCFCWLNFKYGCRLVSFNYYLLMSFNGAASQKGTAHYTNFPQVVVESFMNCLIFYFVHGARFGNCPLNWIFIQFVSTKWRLRITRADKITAKVIITIPIN